MPQSLACRHTCSLCNFTTHKKKLLERHEGTGLRHRGCNEECPRHSSLKNPSIRMLTPDSYLATQLSQPTSGSSSRSSSVSRASSRKRSREPVADEDPEQTLRQEKVKRSLVTARLKLCCVLDPTRRSRSVKDIENDFSWVEWECPGEGSPAKTLLSCPQLKGYIFPHPLFPRMVKIYDWVSNWTDVHVPVLT